MTGSLPQAKQRNAVSFIDRPKLSKTKSLRPTKMQQRSSPTAGLKGISKPANNQDEVSDGPIRDEDFSRADSEDSDEYGGVPKTEDIRLPKIEEPEELAGTGASNRPNFSMNIDNNLSQQDHEGMPNIAVVEDSQLLPQGGGVAASNKVQSLHPNQFKRQGSDQLIYDA